ncbi:precorrin-3B C(17)-methyltransferase [Hippea alviniae]|uniref:precorrin-3B C(17)-methyltransferase n=1 Tax=Hippea alviniae TaxID=1279027 RepID=UPI0003B4DC9F|nr:precorrin-3B C(17)-methyltransferase [Hippea alviniae]
MGKIFVVGLGLGEENMSFGAKKAIEISDAVCGYESYINKIENMLKDKIVFRNGMGGEVERVKKAISLAKKGLTVSVVSSGDSSVYGMASLVYELSDIENIEIVPGITAAISVSARLGAPICEDFVALSLSDLLTPWELIKKRIDAVNYGDFVCAIYNPKSKKRTKQIEYALNRFRLRGNLICGAVKQCCSNHEEIKIMRIDEFDYDFVDMRTTIIVGNTKTYIKNGKMITPRGYDINR